MSIILHLFVTALIVALYIISISMLVHDVIMLKFKVKSPNRFKGTIYYKQGVKDDSKLIILTTILLIMYLLSY